MARPVTAAILALQRDDAAGAISLLEPVRQYDHAPTGQFWPRYIRALAYLRRNDTRAAAAEFQSIIDGRGEVPTSLLYPLAHLGLARAMRQTDPATSRKEYSTFLGLWRDADADLPLVAAARAEAAALR